MSKILKVRIFNYNETRVPYLWVAKAKSYSALIINTKEDILNRVGLFELQIKNLIPEYHNYTCDYVTNSIQLIKPEEYKKLNHYMKPSIVQYMKQNSSDLKTMLDYFPT